MIIIGHFFLIILTISFFYSMAGFNKLLDIGIYWPLNFNFQNYMWWSLEQSIFSSSHFQTPFILSKFGSPYLSVILGFFTILLELSFAFILFSNKLRYFCVLFCILFHIIIFIFTGINFLGNSFFLLLCLDWNKFFSLLKNVQNS